MFSLTPVLVIFVSYENIILGLKKGQNFLKADLDVSNFSLIMNFYAPAFSDSDTKVFLALYVKSCFIMCFLVPWFCSISTRDLHI